MHLPCAVEPAYLTTRCGHVQAYKHLTIIFDDSRSPGEGEHKIMSFIRSQRKSPSYSPDTRHIIHGMDADLIILGNILTIETNNIIHWRSLRAYPASHTLIYTTNAYSSKV